MAFITIGEILKAQGIKGEIKIKPLTDDIERFRKLKMVYIDGVPYKISSKRIDDKFVYLIDGRTRKVVAPKKKSIKHVKVILPKALKELSDRISSGEPVGNERIFSSLSNKKI